MDQRRPTSASRRTREISAPLKLFVGRKQMTNINKTVLAFGALMLAFSAGADDKVIRIDDQSITENRLKNSLNATFSINGRRVEIAFSRETVPGDAFLTVWEHFPDFVAISNFRYLGQESNVIRFNLEKELQKKTLAGIVAEKQLNTIVSYYSKDGGKYLVIPEPFQYTKHHFEIIALPQRGVIGAFFVAPSGRPN